MRNKEERGESPTTQKGENEKKEPVYKYDKSVIQIARKKVAK